MLDKLVEGCWISYGQTTRPGPSPYRIVAMGTRAVEMFSKVL